MICFTTCHYYVLDWPKSKMNYYRAVLRHFLEFDISLMDVKKPTVGAEIG